MMNKNKILIGLIILIVLLIILLVTTQEKNVLVSENMTKKTSELLAGQISTEVPKDIVVPDKETSVEKIGQGVAIPEVVAEAAVGAEAKFRKFSLNVKSDILSPAEIRVNEKDVIHFDLTSGDKKTYSLSIPSYGLSQQAIPGQIKIIEFQANIPGQFEIILKETGKMVGKLIVVPQNK